MTESTGYLQLEKELHITTKRVIFQGKPVKLLLTMFLIYGLS